ncbi:hypothetical protein [Ruegeria arenilitoris]|uniref:hypothetical protein n=1 Tax=Ruegeria arenilitoris TaxID=1173585 RepID=UPI001580676B|nr:hypothetical protein [Ruegeria arenilitoris]
MEYPKLAILLFFWTLLASAAGAQTGKVPKSNNHIAGGLSIVEWNGVKALKLSGRIEHGTTKKFNELSEFAEPAAHGLPILLLDSPGGSVMEALILSAALRNRPFHTIIPNGASCASACASVVFIAGQYRTMEPFGMFGQHSCAVDDLPDQECNELLAQHAFQHGVSHGAVAAFVTATRPEDMLWFSREDIDGWGISRYPGTENTDFEKSEPRAIQAFLGKKPEPQKFWRLDNWFRGWRAFYRPVADDEREMQINQFCIEEVPGTLFLSMEIHGPLEAVKQAVNTVELKSSAFALQYDRPYVFEMDKRVSAVSIAIPTEYVKKWLLEVSDFEFRINTNEPYDPIVAWGNLEGSRENLIFAANHCDYKE